MAKDREIISNKKETYLEKNVKMEGTFHDESH